MSETPRRPAGSPGNRRNNGNSSPRTPRTRGRGGNTFPPRKTPVKSINPAARKGAVEEDGDAGPMQELSRQTRAPPERERDFDLALQSMPAMHYDPLSDPFLEQHFFKPRVQKNMAAHGLLRKGRIAVANDYDYKRQLLERQKREEAKARKARIKESDALFKDRARTKRRQEQIQEEIKMQVVRQRKNEEKRRLQRVAISNREVPPPERPWQPPVTLPRLQRYRQEEEEKQAKRRQPPNHPRARGVEDQRRREQRREQRRRQRQQQEQMDRYFDSLEQTNATEADADAEAEAEAEAEDQGTQGRRGRRAQQKEESSNQPDQQQQQQQQPEEGQEEEASGEQEEQPRESGRGGEDAGDGQAPNPQQQDPQPANAHEADADGGAGGAGSQAQPQEQGGGEGEAQPPPAATGTVDGEEEDGDEKQNAAKEVPCDLASSILRGKGLIRNSDSESDSEEEEQEKQPVASARVTEVLANRKANAATMRKLSVNISSSSRRKAEMVDSPLTAMRKELALDNFARKLAGLPEQEEPLPSARLVGKTSSKVSFANTVEEKTLDEEQANNGNAVPTIEEEGEDEEEEEHVAEPADDAGASTAGSDE